MKMDDFARTVSSVRVPVYIDGGLTYSLNTVNLPKNNKIQTH